jgi:phospholipid transport system substrate-binding protein
MKKLITLFLVINLLWLSQAVSAEVRQDDPVVMVKDMARDILAELKVKQELFRQDPSLIEAFAYEFVMPYVDTARMARYVAGRKWKSASPQQQKDFVEAFSKNLINSYSNTLLKLNIVDVEVVNVRSTKRGKKAITTEVTQDNGKKSIVVYRAFFDKKTQKWMLYDFSVEGISLLVNYRKVFSSEIDKKGFDVVIAELQEKNLTRKQNQLEIQAQVQNSSNDANN